MDAPADLPPAVTIAALVFFGVLFGFLGLLFATPLAVIIMVLVQVLYVQDTLGDDSIQVVGEALPTKGGDEIQPCNSNRSTRT